MKKILKIYEQTRAIASVLKVESGKKAMRKELNKRKRPNINRVIERSIALFHFWWDKT